MKRAMAAFLLASAFAPAEAQTFLDNLRGLRSTLRQLGGTAAGPRASTGSSASTAAAGDVTTATSSATASSDAGMVPASAVADDASDSTLERTPVVARRVETFDVRGLKLGMSPREVGRIADRQGFRRRWTDILETSGSFDVEAAKLANTALNRPIEKTSSLRLRMVQGVDAAGDELKLSFTLEPSGPRLSRLEYVARLNGTTPAGALEAMVRKYGPSNGGFDSVSSRAWTNGAGSDDNASPTLHAMVDGGRVALTLQQSVDYGIAVRERLKARAQEMATARGGGVRF